MRPFIPFFFLLLAASATANFIGAEDAVAELPAGVGPFNPAPLLEKLEQATKEDTYTFAVFGDTKHAKGFSEKVVPFVAKTVNPGFVLTTGDMVQFGGPDYYARLTKEAGEEMKTRPWWPAIGNHECAAPVFNKKDEKDVPKNIDLGKEYFKKFYGLKCEYYSFTFRNAAFIALPWHYPKGETLKWLEDELKKYKDAGKLIFCFNHCPFYTVGAKTSVDVPGKPTEVTALFEKYGVLAVFSGHDHGYYRTARGGVPYVTSAGGGAELYELKRRAEAQPEDVYFGALEGKFLYVNGGKKTEKKYDVPQHFVCVVSVNGKQVTLKTVTVESEAWDEMVLAK
ncbi:MAG: metallophosphoesterase [Planctomycetes bacterium]|nr:metallophosphoesterase [Planctomycetota bacterium]